MKLLLDTQTSNTDGSQSTLTMANSLLFGKYITVVAYGTWDGATVTLEFSPDSGSTWITAGTNTTFTDNGGGNFWSNYGLDIRFSLTSAGESTSISAGVV